MLLIEYKPVDFPEYPNVELARSEPLRCTWADLIWAAATIYPPLLPLTIHPGSYPFLELKRVTAGVDTLFWN